MKAVYHVKGKFITQFEDNMPIEFEAQSETFTDLVERLIDLGMGIQGASDKLLRIEKMHIEDVYVNHRW